MRSRAKNQKSTHGIGDLQTKYHQVKRSQPYAQTSDAKDSTHLDDQSNTVMQNSGRRRFLNRGVRRIFARDCTFVFFKTIADKTIMIL